MTEPIDRLIFALDGDLKALKEKYAEAEAGAKKTGTTIAANLNQGFKQSAADATRHAEQLKSAFGDIGTHAEHARTHIFTLTRELRALVYELSSGRIGGAAATMGVMTLRMSGLTFATVAWGAAIAAIPVAFTAAAISAENSMARIRSAIALTGNASGLSAAQADIIAQQIAAGGRMSEGGARSFVAGAVGNLIPAGSIGTAGTAAGNYQLATGAKTEEVQRLLRGMFEDPSKSAAELNAQMRLLSAAQVREIDDLQKSGEYQRAGAIVLDAFNKRAKEAADQTGTFMKALDNATTALGNFWTGLGKTFGAGVTDADRLASLQRQRDQILQHGIPGRGGSPQQIQNSLAAIDAQMAPLRARMAAEAAVAQAADVFDKQQQAITLGLSDSDKEANQFANHLRELKDELARDNKAVDAAKTTHSQFTGELVRQRDAVKVALANAISPEREAILRAQEQTRINAAKPEDRAVLEAQIEAQRELRRNLANPATALQARGIYNAQLAAAEDPNRFLRQKLNLEVMQQEAAAQEDLAEAIKHGTAAFEQQKITIDAHLARLKGEILDEQAYADALRRRAFAQAEVATGQNIENLRIENISRRNSIAAAGNPVLLAQAARAEEARKATEGMFNAASTPQELIKAVREFSRTIEKLEERDRQNAIIAAQGQLYGAQRGLGNQRATLAAMRAGATPDDLRHLQVAQSTFEDLIRTGLDPATEDFKRLYNQMVQVNEQTSDLSDALEKTSKAAQDFASAITGPVGQLLRPGGSIGGFAQGVEQNVIAAAVKNFIVDPLQKQLEGVFAKLLGTSAAPDGSMGKPYHVIVQNGGVTGVTGGGAGSGLEKLIGSLFGGGGGPDAYGQAFQAAEAMGMEGASAAGGGGFLSGLFGGGGGGLMSLFTSALSFIGLAEGGRKPYGQYRIVGEKGPEILGPDVAGYVTPMSAPVVGSMFGRFADPNMFHGSGGLFGQIIEALAGDTTHHWHFHGPTDAKDIMRSKGQLAAIVARTATRGKRGT